MILLNAQLPTLARTSNTTTKVYSVSTSVGLESSANYVFVHFAPAVLGTTTGLAVGIGVDISVTPTPVVENDLHISFNKRVLLLPQSLSMGYNSSHFITSINKL